MVWGEFIPLMGLTRQTRDLTHNKLFEHRLIKISKLFEVQTGLAHLVPAKLGQQGSLLLSLGHQIDHQFSTADGKACQRGFPGSPAFVDVAVRAITDHAGSPHSWCLTGDPLE